MKEVKHIITQNITYVDESERKVVPCDIQGTTTGLEKELL